MRDLTFAAAPFHGERRRTDRTSSEIFFENETRSSAGREKLEGMAIILAKLLKIRRAAEVSLNIKNDYFR